MEIKPMRVEFCEAMLSDTKRIIKGLKEELDITSCEESKKYIENQLKYGEYEVEHWTKNLEFAKNYYR